MACDVNWLKLKKILEEEPRKTKPLNVQQTTLTEGKEIFQGKLTATQKKLRGNYSSTSKSYPITTTKKHILKRYGVGKDEASNFSKEYWENEEGLRFDILAAPKKLKRDIEFEKFLIDDRGYVVDEESKTENIKRDSTVSANNNADSLSGRTEHASQIGNPSRTHESSLSNVGDRNKRGRLQLELNTQFNEVTKAVAMDCEMVGALKSGNFSLLARVSIVNTHGHVLYDKYVRPSVDITDYRTAVSGITAQKLQEEGEPLEKVQKEVAALLKGRILVGHAISYDLKVLFLEHPKKDIRDTSFYPPCRELSQQPRCAPSLKMLADKILGLDIQSGQHDSVQDAQVAMKIYMRFRSKWELWLGRKMKKAGASRRSNDNDKTQDSDKPKKKKRFIPKKERKRIRDQKKKELEENGIES